MIMSLQIVPPEIALKLKDTNFEPPKFEMGQCWYSPTGHLIILDSQKTALYLFKKPDTALLPSPLFEKDVIFAPNSYDIQEKMPGWTCGWDKQGTWTCYCYDNGQKIERTYTDKNPTLAFANAWLGEHSEGNKKG